MLTYLLWHSEKIIINDSGKLSNSREKTFADGRNKMTIFAGGCKIAKFVNIFSLESFPLHRSFKRING